MFGEFSDGSQREKFQEGKEGKEESILQLGETVF